MKKWVLLSSAAVLAASAYQPAVAQEELVYVAVEPCRIADTRQSDDGVIRADTSRNFLIAGTAKELASQGGDADCLNPKGDEQPVAVSAYILAVPAGNASGQGALSAYPSDQDEPPAGSGSTVNFASGQTIGNTTNATVCADGNNCPSDGELAILARRSDQNVVIDVQGYFYPPSGIIGYELVRAPFAIANANSVTAQAPCTSGKRVLGGGGRLSVASTWYLEGSYPLSDGSAWRVNYRTTGSNFSVSGEVWAICAPID
jgi:hypothetical protein